MNSNANGPAASAPTVPDLKQVAGNGAKYIVACKLPNGLKLEMGKLGEDKYETFTLSPARRVIAQLATEDRPASFTEVPKAFMDAWMKKHSWHPAVRKRLLNVFDDLASAQAWAMDNSQNRTGFEALSTKDLPKGVTEVEDQMRKVRSGA